MGQKQSLVASQSATISPAAAAFIQNVPHIPFAGLVSSWLTSPSKIPGFREKFGKVTREKEDELIAKYRLKITEKEIEGVKVLIVEPPSMPLEKADKVLLNIHGGAFVLGVSHTFPVESLRRLFFSSLAHFPHTETTF
jgi:epsilon-lactone hydrolase